MYQTNLVEHRNKLQVMKLLSKTNKKLTRFIKCIDIHIETKATDKKKMKRKYEHVMDG
jgi:hypothetical protein